MNSVYSFHGLVYMNGSEPKITSNISDSEVVKNLTDILHLFGLEVSDDLETSGKLNFKTYISTYFFSCIRLDPAGVGGVSQ